MWNTKKLLIKNTMVVIEGFFDLIRFFAINFVLQKLIYISLYRVSR